MAPPERLRTTGGTMSAPATAPEAVQHTSTATSPTASGSERLQSTADLPQRPRATSVPRVRIEGSGVQIPSAPLVSAGQSPAWLSELVSLGNHGEPIVDLSAAADRARRLSRLYAAPGRGRDRANARGADMIGNSTASRPPHLRAEPALLRGGAGASVPTSGGPPRLPGAAGLYRGAPVPEAGRSVLVCDCGVVR